MSSQSGPTLAEIVSQRPAPGRKGRGATVAEEIMPAETASVRLATRDTPGGDRRPFQHGGVPCDEGPPPLLDYAAFVLEQEAAYCQQ